MTGGSVPTTAVSTNFPETLLDLADRIDYYLVPQALDNFLQSLSSTVSTAIGVNAALSLVFCTVISSNGTQCKFDDAMTHVFSRGALINVASYQCAVIIGA